MRDIPIVSLTLFVSTQPCTENVGAVFPSCLSKLHSTQHLLHEIHVYTHVVNP